MRVLLYLPVCNPWWFEHVITPLVRLLAPACDLHLMIPAPWNNTGLSADELAAAALPGVTLHHLDRPEHPELRLCGTAYPGLLALVRQIAPDLTIARAADRETLARFPGEVRFLMEATVPLLDGSYTRKQLTRSIFDHGFLPPLAPADRAALAAAVEPAWNTALAACPPRTGPALPDGRKLVVLPLEYEHPEMFFRALAPFPTNVDLIHALAAALPDDVLLAVTHHPLTLRYMDTHAVDAAVALYPDRIVTVPETGDPGRTTAMLARRADGMIVIDSKSIFLPAMFGTPCLRLSNFATAPWMQVYTDAAAFFADLSAGTASAADPADAQAWAGWHLHRQSFDLADPGLTAADILARADLPALAQAA